MWTAGATGSSTYSLAFSYDRYGNLSKIDGTQSGTGCSQYTLNLSVNSNNQINSAGFAYDAAGNMTSDGTNTYTWDAEGRMKSVSNNISGTTNYTYDGDGRRVEKSSGTLYWYAPLEGSILTETDLSGNLLKDYVYFAGSRIAMLVNHLPYFYYGDTLGSARVVTNYVGGDCYDADFYPFGGERIFTNTCAQNYKFTGMERDGETGNDHTWFRAYSSGLGRWLSPDPLAGDITNPQSLNRYAYVLNNPCSLTDSLGLQSCTFSINIINPSNQPLGQIEDEIARAFSTADLGVAFGQPQSDYNLTLAPSIQPYAQAWNLGPTVVGSTIPGPGGIPTTSGYVYLDRAEQFASSAPQFWEGDPTANLAYTIGRAGAHEIAHGLLGDPGHTPDSIMQAAFSPSQWFSLNGSPTEGFTATQATQLQTQCKHPPANNSGPGGGSNSLPPGTAGGSVGPPALSHCDLPCPPGFRLDYGSCTCVDVNLVE